MNPKQFEQATKRQKQVAKLLELKQGPWQSLGELGRAAGISGPTACRWLRKFKRADLPLEYYSDGYKEPLPLPTQIELAEESYRLALANVAELKEKLKLLAGSYRYAKERAESARIVFSDLVSIGR
jgi:hypothetical protein